ncbi:MAG: hypothetical protein KBC12_02800 [Candidatus Pacebacteria bacterium]|nr:hypothetical protein [Candidatus Paceibacterota bacterium]MBP9851369.1 hypothetical protein [Candidatus Paceibacterota bacterium]
MVKKIMSDMVSKNSSQTESRKTVKRFVSEKEENTKIDERLNKLHLLKKKNDDVAPRVDIEKDAFEGPVGEPHKGHKSLWFVALFAVLVLFLALSSNFSSAKVTITPKSKDFKLEELLSAVRGSVEGPDLSFEIVSMEGSESTNITATTQKDMKTPARGQVLIYNKYGASPQKLSIDTRLEGSNGKIYKTEKEVVIPGMTGDAPGFTKVGVYGYEPGEEYNSGPLDFKVFGFRGTGKYDKFYARSEGDITGGLSGKFYVVSEEEKTKVSSGLTMTLKDNLTKKVLEQVPEDYVLFKDSLIFKEGSSNVSATQKEESAPVSVTGSVFGFLFKESDLVKKVAKIAVPDYNGEEVFIPELQKFILAFGNKDALSVDSKNLNFRLTGTGKVVYKINEDEIAGQLLSRKKDDFKKILAENKNIESAELVLRPVWRTKLPDKLKRIKIIVNYGDK